MLCYVMLCYVMLCYANVHFNENVMTHCTVTHNSSYENDLRLTITFETTSVQYLKQQSGQYLQRRLTKIVFPIVC